MLRARPGMMCWRAHTTHRRLSEGSEVTQHPSPVHMPPNQRSRAKALPLKNKSNGRKKQQFRPGPDSWLASADRGAVGWPNCEADTNRSCARGVLLIAWQGKGDGVSPMHALPPFPNAGNQGHARAARDILMVCIYPFAPASIANSLAFFECFISLGRPRCLAVRRTWTTVVFLVVSSCCSRAEPGLSRIEPLV